MLKTIYLDYAATTPVAAEVAAMMAQYLTFDGVFANPASRTYQGGWLAEQAVENAREEVAKLLGADLREIIWTSGATEANNLALIGVARAYQHVGKHLITSALEHRAVLDTCRWLETQGYAVTYLKPDAYGQISVEQVQAALRPDTFMVSLMLVNNELGTVNPIASIGALLKNTNTLLHVDAAQAAGKIPIDVEALQVDLLSLSGHKFYGPKGVGALYVRRQPQVKLEAIIHGGQHERGLRSGTLPTHQLVGIGKAAQLAVEQLAADTLHLQACRAALLAELSSVTYRQTAASATNFAGIINLCFPKVEAETLIMALPELAMATGSACSAASVDPSYVLLGCGLSRADALSSLRLSFGRYLTVEQAQQAGRLLNKAVASLQN